MKVLYLHPQSVGTTLKILYSCEAVKFSQSIHPLPKVASIPAIKQKQLNFDLIIYKHFTHTKLHHPTRGRFHEMFFNPEVTQGNLGITICPHCLHYHQNKKIKSCYSPSILISFSSTRNKKMNSSTRQIKLTHGINSWAIA